MKNLLERDDEEKTVTFAVRHGILHLKGNRAGNTGWPDQEFFFNSRMVFMELKRRGEDLKKNQPERIDKLVGLGFTVGVFDDYRTASYFLEATLLSESWCQTYDPAGVCWIALQARAWKDQRGLYGVPYFAGQTVRSKTLVYLPHTPRVQCLARPERQIR